MHAKFRQRAERLFGFVPDLLARIGSDEPLTDTYLYALERVSKGALTREERAVVQLTATTELECDGCLEFDFDQAVRANVPVAELERIVRKREPGNARLRAVSAATRTLVATKGRLHDDQRHRLDAVGIERTQLYTIISLIAAQVLSNYATHVLGSAQRDASDD